MQVKAPGNSSPMGNKLSPAPATPTVPITVMAFGVIGVRARALPTGVNRRVMAGRSTFSMAVRYYCASPGGDPPEPPDHGGAARPPVPPWPPGPLAPLGGSCW